MPLLGLIEGQNTRTILVVAVVGIMLIGAIVRQRIHVRSRRRLQAAIQAYNENELSRYIV
jgi:hypothetical protein